MRSPLDGTHDLAHDGTIGPLGLLETSNGLVDDGAQFSLWDLGNILGVLLQYIQVRLLLLDQVLALRSCAFLNRRIGLLDLLLDQRVESAIVLDRAF